MPLVTNGRASHAEVEEGLNIREKDKRKCLEKLEVDGNNEFEQGRMM